MVVNVDGVTYNTRVREEPEYYDNDFDGWSLDEVLDDEDEFVTVSSQDEESPPITKSDDHSGAQRDEEAREEMNMGWPSIEESVKMLNAPSFAGNKDMGKNKILNTNPPPKLLKRSNCLPINLDMANNIEDSVELAVGPEGGTKKFINFPSGSSAKGVTHSAPAQNISNIFIDLKGPPDGPTYGDPTESDYDVKDDQIGSSFVLEKAADPIQAGLIKTSSGKNNKGRPTAKSTKVRDKIKHSHEVPSDSELGISMEARKAWEVWKKLGLIGKVSDEEMIKQMEMLEKRDRLRTKREAGGRSGGILSIWSSEVFRKSSSWYSRGILVVNGFFTKDGVRGVLINVYAPCLSSEKATLWDNINLIVEQNDDAQICVVGDFNSIRFPEERVGRREVSESGDTACFDNFIN
ncbi:hypothetical protein ACS0TY_033965 [Phlomoides rotata]